jgi:hypothetical protein
MVSSGMLRRVALVRTDVSEEPSASIIRVTRICELGTRLAVTSNRRTLRRNTTANAVPSSTILVTLMKEALSSSETSLLTRATRRNNPEDAILRSHRHENFKSYVMGIVFCAVRVVSRAKWRSVRARTSRNSLRRPSVFTSIGRRFPLKLFSFFCIVLHNTKTLDVEQKRCCYDVQRSGHAHWRTGLPAYLRATVDKDIPCTALHTDTAL